MRSQALRYNAGLIRANGIPFAVDADTQSGQLVDRQGNPISSNKVRRVDAIHRTDWQGRQLLYPAARTNMLPRSQTLDLWNHSTAIQVAVADASYGGQIPYFVCSRLDATTTSASVSYALRDGSGSLFVAQAGDVIAFTLGVRAASDDTGHNLLTFGIYMGGWGAVGTGEVVSGPGLINAYSTIYNTIWNVFQLTSEEDTLIKVTRTVTGQEAVLTPTCYIYPCGTPAKPVGNSIMATRAMATVNNVEQGGYIETPALNAVTVTDYDLTGSTAAFAEKPTGGAAYDWSGLARR